MFGCELYLITFELFVLSFPEHFLKVGCASNYRQRLKVTKTLQCCNVLVVFTEPQVRSIANHVRPDRQSKCCHGNMSNILLYLALLFSATFRKKVERLCRDILTDPVRIVVGSLGEVCIVTVVMATFI